MKNSISVFISCLILCVSCKTTKQINKAIQPKEVVEVVVDKNTIKEIIENNGGIVEVVIFNDIKNDINIKNKMHSKVKFDKVNIQFFIEHIFL